MFSVFAHNGKLLSVIVLIICVLGLAAAWRIPVQMIPDLDVRTVTVRTGWPGATPQDVEKEILIEQERYLRSLPNLRRMESFAETGRATIELEYPFGVDINEALIRVSNALNQVPGYPENVDQPQLFSSSFSQNAFLYFVVTPARGNPLGLDMDMLTDFTDDYVRPQMERVPGVSQVDLWGGAERQIQVRVDPSRLAQRGIRLTDVRAAIRARNRDRSAGDLDDGKRRYLIRTVGRFHNVEELQDLILAHRNGTDIRLRDVADVRLDHYEVRGLTYVDGERGIYLAVRRETGSNVIDIKENMLRTVDVLRRELLEPNGLRMMLMGDDVRYVQSSIRNVLTNLCLGALLATGVMFLFLRSPRATLIGVMGIPVCTIAAFLGLLLCGRTINVISLAGVAFAIGMTVDNTIVVLENIEHARRRGMTMIDAAIKGVSEVWPAVLASTATTVLVFAPVLLIEEEAGQLYSDIAIAISASILVSMLFAVAVVPPACARIGFGNGKVAATVPANGRIMAAVHWLTATAGRRGYCIGITLLATLSATWVLLPPAEYLPEGEEPKAFSTMKAPPGYNLQEMEVIGDEIRELLSAAVAADPEDYEPGPTTIPPLAYYSLRISPGTLWVLSEPRDDDNIHRMMDALTNLFASYPGMRGFSGRGSIISSSQGGTRAVNLDISGPELEGLYRTAESAFRRARDLFDRPQLDSEPSSLSLDQPLVQIQPRWDRLAETGFTADEFGFTVASLSDGAFVDEFFLDDDKIDIFLFSQAGQRQDLRGLAELPILTPGGEVLPLAALARIQETVDSDSLRRLNGHRTVTLLIIPPRDVALETAVDRVRNRLVPEMQAAGEIADGVKMTISGAADQLEATRKSLSGNFLISLVLIYLVLVAIFSHWGYPLLILATVPLGICGGILGLVAVNGSGQLLEALGLAGFHQSFDMITMLGFVILLGTVVNNPILIVHQARKNLENPETGVEQAVRAAVATRLRPILMSTVTTVFGLAPLVLIPGSGTELYRGVGIVVLLGILSTMVVALSFLPCLLITVLKRTR